MASISAAWTATLGTVAKSANTITSTVDTIDTVMLTLNDKARDFRRHQKLSDAGRETQFIGNLTQTIAREAAELEHQTEQWANQHPDLKVIYDKKLAEISAAISQAQSSL
jgi:hypothetical protein